MRKKRRTIRIVVSALLLSAVLFLLVSCAAEPEDAAAQPLLGVQGKVETVRSSVFTVKDGQIEKRVFRVDCDGSPAELRCYEMENGDAVLAGSLRPQEGAASLPDREEAVCVFQICRKEAGLHYLADGTWRSGTGEGDYSAGCIVLDTDEGNYLLYLPQMAQRIENGCVRMIADGSGFLRVAKEGNGGYRISMYAPLPAQDCTSDYMIARTSCAPVDWNDPDATDLWAILGNDGSWRMMYDGYYYASADNYEPTGENVYANRPACHLAWVFAHHGSKYPVMGELNYCILDAMMECLDPDGYWKSNAKSLWLSGAYGIGAGYYDTRFNSDLAAVMLDEYARTGWEALRQTIESYLLFYARYAEAYGQVSASGALFVPDYYYPGMQTPHTSLNHQLSEIGVLYRAAALFGRDDLLRLGDRMLLAVEETETSWIKEDGNLEYALYPDGTFGGNDYPTLTYNDMFSLQALLREMGREPDACLQRLMDSKKAWMDARGITDYSK